MVKGMSRRAFLGGTAAALLATQVPLGLISSPPRPQVVYFSNLSYRVHPEQLDGFAHHLGWDPSRVTWTPSGPGEMRGELR